MFMAPNDSSSVSIRTIFAPTCSTTEADAVYVYALVMTSSPGFIPSIAVVTHYRLKNDPEGSGVIVDPAARLEEELIIRPTSETIIWNTYKNWIQSYRVLPLLINQWANVMR